MENMKDAIGSNRGAALGHFAAARARQGNWRGRLVAEWDGGAGNERGTVLVIVLLVMVVVSILGVTLLKISTTEQNIAFNEQIMESAFFGAEAALAQAWYGLDGSGKPNPVPNTAKQQAVNCANPDYDSVSLAITGGTVQYSTICATPTGGVGAAQMTPMFIQNDLVAVCAQGGAYDTSFGCARYQINVQAVAPGNSTRQIEAGVEYGPIQVRY